MSQPWDGTGVDPYLPARIAHEIDVTAAERRVYKAWWGSLSQWLVEVHRGVLASDRPDPNAVWAHAPEWSSLMDGVVYGSIRDAVGLPYAQLFGEEYLFDQRPAVTAYLGEVHNRMVNTPEQVYDMVASQLARGAAAGEAIPAIADRVSNVLTTTGTENWRGRAVTVARTEALGALSAGRADAYTVVAEALGEDLETVWLATLDRRVRPAHLEADLQRVPLGTPFTVGGEHLMRPGDPAGSPWNVIQCRCSTLLERPGESTDMTGRGFADEDEWWATQAEGGVANDVCNCGLPRGSLTAAGEAKPGKCACLIAKPLRSAGAPSLATMFDEEDAASRVVYDINAGKFGRWVNGNYAGLDVEVTSASAGYGVLAFEGKIRDPATGRAVGKFERAISRDADGKMYAKHELLEIQRKYQGSGFQAEFNGNLIDWYKRSGLSYVKVGANIDIGGYTWARAGYDFADTGSALGLISGLHDRLAEMQGGPVHALEWLDADHNVPAYRWGGPVVFEGKPAWTKAQLRKAFKGASDAEIQRQLQIGNDWLASLDGKRFGHDLPSAYEMSQLGRWDGAGKNDVWIGKLNMLGSSWWGVLRL